MGISTLYRRFFWNAAVEQHCDAFDICLAVSCLSEAPSIGGLHPRLLVQLARVGPTPSDYDFKFIGSGQLINFKLINDKFGHDVGDGVLTGLVSLIKSRIRNTDALARWGGEEFVLICQNTTLEIARILVEKHRVGIAEHPLCGQPITRCFGVSQLKSSDVASAFKEADVALYQANAMGRNQVWG